MARGVGQCHQQPPGVSPSCRRSVRGCEQSQVRTGFMVPRHTHTHTHTHTQLTRSPTAHSLTTHSCTHTARSRSHPSLTHLLTRNYSLLQVTRMYSHCSLSHSPSLTHLLTRNYSLLQVTRMCDFQFFFNRFTTIGVRDVIKRARRFVRETPKEINPILLVGQFEPLQPGA